MHTSDLLAQCDAARSRCDIFLLAWSTHRLKERGCDDITLSDAEVEEMKKALAHARDIRSGEKIAYWIFFLRYFCPEEQIVPTQEDAKSIERTAVHLQSEGLYDKLNHLREVCNRVGMSLDACTVKYENS